jgi:hypothetical protein
MLRERRVSKRRICSLHQLVLMRVPEVDVRLVILRVFLLLPLDRRHPLLLLISDTGRFSRFATSQEGKDSEQRHKLKLFHI